MPSGKNYEHRRQWIEDKILQLGQIFSIDVCNYAIMHNHYHVLLHVNSQESTSWSTIEVVSRWHQLFKGTVLTQRLIDNISMTKAEITAVEKLALEWRSRLNNISWFMRILNEGIARQANKEDDCTGRFWEGRFYSQALLDDKALTACMAYIDLNPIRSGIAKTTDSSNHTSIKIRVNTASQSQIPNRVDQQTKLLFPFSGNPSNDSAPGIPMKLTDYIDLVEWSAHQILNKQKNITSSQPPILNQLGIESNNWLFLCENFEIPFKYLVGSAISLQQVCVQLKQRWIQGQRNCKRLFSSS